MYLKNTKSSFWRSSFFAVLSKKWHIISDGYSSCFFHFCFSPFPPVYMPAVFSYHFSSKHILVPNIKFWWREKSNGNNSINLELLIKTSVSACLQWTKGFMGTCSCTLWYFFYGLDTRIPSMVYFFCRFLHKSVQIEISRKDLFLYNPAACCSDCCFYYQNYQKEDTSC